LQLLFEAVDDGWNGVGRFAKSFRRKPTEVFGGVGKIWSIILERSDRV